METLVDNISDLASKVLEIFGENEKTFTRKEKYFHRKTFSEPMAKSKLNTTELGNTYFVSFLLRNRRNNTQGNDDQGLQRMVVNNNFSGQKMDSRQDNRFACAASLINFSLKLFLLIPDKRFTRLALKSVNHPPTIFNFCKTPRVVIVFRITNNNKPDLDKFSDCESQKVYE